MTLSSTIDPTITDGSTENTDYMTTSTMTNVGDVTPLSGNTYAVNDAQSAYIFEAEIEGTQLLSADAFLTTRKDLIDAKVVFGVPLTSTEMLGIFKDFGRFRNSDGSDYLESAVAAEATRVKDNLWVAMNRWFVHLNTSASAEGAKLSDGDEASNQIIDNWNEMLTEMALLLTAYFGRTLLGTKVVTRTSVKNLLGSEKITSMFAFSTTQLVDNAQQWRDRHWGDSIDGHTGEYTRNSFPSVETDKMVMAFPFRFQVTSEGTESNREEFVAKVVFGKSNDAPSGTLADALTATPLSGVTAGNLVARE